MVDAKRLALSIWLAIAVQPIFILSSSAILQAQQQQPSGKQGAPSFPITLNLETERGQIEPGSFIGALADITNNSSVPIYIRAKDVRLVLPSEVEKGSWEWNSSFLSEDDVREGIILLKPHETYRSFTFRDPGVRVSDYSPLRWYQVINFAPGKYPVSVLVKYWEHRKFDGEDYHLAVAAKNVDFVAPEWVILLGAVIGGVLFAFLSIIRAEEAQQKIAKKLATLVGSALLGVVITILASRITEAQNIIKVNISDIWGAVAIGFLGNYGGWALLDKMVPSGSKGATKENPELKAESGGAQKTNSSAPG